MITKTPVLFFKLFLFFVFCLFLLMRLNIFPRFAYWVFHFVVNNEEAVVLQSSVFAERKKSMLTVDLCFIYNSVAPVENNLD